MPKRSNLQLEESLGGMVYPGDEFSIPSSRNLVLGPGLRLMKEKISVSIPGRLARKGVNVFFIEFRQRNYSSFPKEDVVAVVNKGVGDAYKLDIGTGQRVQLSKFAFEGATKKFRPHLKVGDVVFGRLLPTPRDIPVNMTCVLPSGKSQGLGPLEGGYIISVPIAVVRDIRRPDGEKLFESLGKLIQFESAIGANGLIWIKAKTPVDMALLVLAIQKASFEMPHQQIARLLKDSL